MVQMLADAAATALISRKSLAAAVPLPADHPGEHQRLVRGRGACLDHGFSGARPAALLGNLACAGRHAAVRAAGVGRLGFDEMVRRYAHLAADHLAPYAERFV
jgi:hypothetical protein